MHIDGVERHFIFEMQTTHHHAGDPEENNIEAGDQNIGFVMACQFRRFIRPTQSRERPQRGREPRVEHIFIACQGNALTCLRLRRFFAFGDKHIAVFVIPSGNLMPPPKLARNTPGLDIVHPLEIGFVPIGRHEFGRAAFYRFNRRFRHSLGIDIPLVGQPRLNHLIGAVAIRHHMRIRLDFIDQPQPFQRRNNFLARLIAVKPVPRVFAVHRVESFIG